MNRKYSKETLEDLVKSSRNLTEVVRKLNLRTDGGDYANIKKRVIEFGIDTSHFVSGNKGVPSKQRKSATEYLASSCIKSHTLKNKLIQDGVKKHECEMCKRTEWLGNPIPLHLDHINGDDEDNRLENLRIICPNCHATTPTYAGKNKRLKRLRKLMDSAGIGPAIEVLETSYVPNVSP